MATKVAKSDNAPALKTVAPLKLAMPKLGQSTTPPLGGAAPGAEVLRPAALGMAHLAGDEGGASSDDEGDGTEAVLMQAITQFFSKRDEETKAKRASVLNETLAKIKTAAEGAQAAIQKDGKEAQAEARGAILKLERGMEATQGEIKSVIDKFQEDLRVLYHKYSTQYEQLEAVKQEATVKVQQRKASAKRKFSALKGQVDKALAEADERLAKLKPRKSPMDLYKAIETFNASS